MSTAIGDFEFVTTKFEDGHTFDFPFHSSAPTPYGPVSVDDSKLWWSSDYVVWNQANFGEGLGGMVLDGDNPVALSGSGATRLAWDGNRWSPGERIDVPDQVDWIVFGPRPRPGRPPAPSSPGPDSADSRFTRLTDLHPRA